MTCLIYSNPPVPCPAGMYSLGGKFDNCTACPAGSACPDPAGAPVGCTGGKKFLCQSRRTLSCLRPALLIGYLVGFRTCAGRTHRSVTTVTVRLPAFTLFNSCHLPNVRKGFVKGDALRILRKNSSETTFEENNSN